LAGSRQITRLQIIPIISSLYQSRQFSKTYQLKFLTLIEFYRVRLNLPFIRISLLLYLTALLK